LEPAEDASRISRISNRIRTLVSVAAAHGSSISSAELVLLLPIGLFKSPKELESYLENDATLSQELLVSDGQITLKGLERLARGTPDRIDLSTRRAQIAESFSDRLVRACPWIRLVAISGSTAYAGNNPDDDLDFYIVTRRNRLWATLLFAMLAARLYKLENSESPQLCFNRFQEEDECQDSFRSLQDPLFAREALSLRVLRGQSYYNELVRSASWMQHFFPGLFRQVLASAPLPTQVNETDSRVWSIVNGMAFVVLPPYLALVGAWRNRRLAHEARLDARFRTVIQRGFFAYESKKYDHLRDIYRQVF
jgi:hypothetical protein